MYRQYFKIADLVLELILPFKYFEMEEFSYYRIDAAEEPDVSVEFLETKEKPQVEGKPLLVDFSRITLSAGKIYVEFLLEDFKTAYGCLVQKEEDSRYTCYLYEGAREQLPHSTQIFKVICMDHILNQKGAFFLHASYIRWKDKGTLFCAPSGVGKSTQAALWEQYENAEVINGDRTILRKMDGKWNAYGSPYCGSSKAFKNITTEVRAIVLLHQSQVNKLRKAKTAEALKFLYRESIIHSWDKRYMERLMDLLEDVVRNIPIYILECRPDREAVEILRKGLE